MFYYTERDVRCKMMAEGKIIDVADKKTSHSQYICQNKVIRQKVRNFRNTFIPSPILFFNLNSLIIRSFKSRNWLNYHTLPCDRLNWHTLLNQWEDRKFTWSIIKKIVECHRMSENSCVGLQIPMYLFITQWSHM